MTLKFIKGNLLDCQDQYIAHQTNCVSVGAGGIAAAIFDRFPYSNVYARRASGHRDAPGTIIVSGVGDERRVINMMAQVYPGRPKFSNSNLDGTLARENYFKSCLGKVSAIDGLESISFPFKIGCGLAGGDWDNYLAMISDFSKSNPLVEVGIWVME